jgi:hypothetical protein
VHTVSINLLLFYQAYNFICVATEEVINTSDGKLEDFPLESQTSSQTSKYFYQLQLKSKIERVEERAEGSHFYFFGA